MVRDVPTAHGASHPDCQVHMGKHNRSQAKYDDTAGETFEPLIQLSSAYHEAKQIGVMPTLERTLGGLGAQAGIAGGIEPLTAGAKAVGGGIRDAAIGDPSMPQHCAVCRSGQSQRGYTQHNQECGGCASISQRVLSRWKNFQSKETT